MTVLKGRIAFEGPIASRILGANRFVRVYLPPSYGSASRTQFPVLYVHDGQNTFTTVGDDVAFGWGNWQLDRTVDELIAARRMREIIIVSIDCSAQRYLEYRGPAHGSSSLAPAGSKRRFSAPDRDGRFEGYGRFLCEELKPRMDAEYRTLPRRDNTGLMGSSMGGLCSLALAWKYPQVFGKVASLSGSFQVERGTFRLHHLAPWPRRSKPHIYLDSGVIDEDGSDDGRTQTAAVARQLRDLGWSDGVNLTAYVDEHVLTEAELARTGIHPGKWKEAQRSQHNELYWRLRVWRPLTFLFPPLRQRRNVSSANETG